MLEKEVTYTGQLNGWEILKDISLKKEYIEVFEGNTRRSEATGGLIITATFDVCGDVVSVEATVAAASVASMTLAQLLNAAETKLKEKLGLT